MFGVRISSSTKCLNWPPKAKANTHCTRSSAQFESCNTTLFVISCIPDQPIGRYKATSWDLTIHSCASGDLELVAFVIVISPQPARAVLSQANKEHDCSGGST